MKSSAFAAKIRDPSVKTHDFFGAFSPLYVQRRNNKAPAMVSSALAGAAAGDPLRPAWRWKRFNSLKDWH